MKLFLLPALLLIGWAASAQTTGTNNSSDTTHHHMMHHRWGNGMGGDSLAKRDGFHHRAPGGPDGWAYHHPGQGQWGHGRGDHGDRFGHGGRHKGWGDRGMMAAHYTPQQRQQAMAINKDFKQKSEDLFKQDNITLKQYKAGLIALQKDKKSKLQALLTPQQNNEMAARRKNMAENAQVMEVAHLERLKLHLNLSDDQIAKIKAGQENLRSQVKAIHENDNLLPQEKRDQMKALMAKRNDTYKSVLTPDQYTQFEKMHHHDGRDGSPMQDHHEG